MTEKLTFWVGLAIIATTLLAGNAVPVEPKTLFEHSDSVVLTKVVKLDFVTRLRNGSRPTCILAKVERNDKGRFHRYISICQSGAAEFDPPRPRQGQRYLMYLKRSPLGYFYTFSYAGFKGPLAP